MTLDTLKSLQARIRNSVGPDRELDYEIADALGTRSASDYTASLDACVALQEAVLLGYRRNSIETQTGEWLLALFGEVHVIEDRHALETHAHLLAIFAAVIAREEAKEKINGNV